jgi:hypothetical protein
VSKRFAAVIAALLVVGGVLFVVLRSGFDTSRVERPSPAVAAQPVRATVTRAVVRQSYVFTGTLTARSASRSLPAQGVVSGLPMPSGTVVRPGRAVLEVNGRPVIALDIPFPLWRDLTPGIEGKDVLVVQGALVRLGLMHAHPNGTFGPATQAAVARLYADLDYPVTTVSRLAVDKANSSVPSDTADHEGVTGHEPGAPSLPSGEVIAIGGGPWHLDLAGADVGSMVAAEGGPQLAGIGSRLEVDDGGQLAGLLKPDSGKTLTLVTGTGAASTEAVVVSASVQNTRSMVVVRSSGESLATGTVSGSAVAASSKGPVLTVPVTALRPSVEGGTTVRLVTSGGVRDIEVTVGLRGDRLVEVTGEALVEGAQVELP